MTSAFRYRDPGSATYTSCSYPGSSAGGPILVG